MSEEKKPEELQGLVKIWLVYIMDYNAATKINDLWANLTT